MKFRCTLYAALASLLLAASLIVLARETPSSNGVPVRMLVTVEATHGSSVPVINREEQRVKLTTEVPNAELVSADRVYVPAAP